MQTAVITQMLEVLGVMLMYTCWYPGTPVWWEPGRVEIGMLNHASLNYTMDVAYVFHGVY